MNKRERYNHVIDYFIKHQPDAKTELIYNNPFELLVAVILSAQCTDKRINQVTPALFKKFPTPQTLANSDFDELFPFIKSVSYPRNKTKHLLQMAKMLVEEFQNEIPYDAKKLQKLPGVGRKTANVITSVIYNQPAMAVDTHVFRVAKRLGLVTNMAKTPLAVEKQLVRHLPKELIAKAHHWLILHGRYVCKARQPDCNTCSISQFCKFYEKEVNTMSKN